MAIVEMELDPNAAAYTDDEIVGKVNSATAKVNADSCEDGTTNKVYTGVEQTKLGKTIVTDPQTDEFTVVSLQRKSTGKLGIKYDETAVL